jgi:integrase
MRDQNYIPQPARRPDGRGVVRLNGKDHYLGQAGDWPKSHKKAPAPIQAAYEGLISRWLANGRQFPEDLDTAPTMNEVMLAYTKFAEVHYHREGKECTHLGMVKDALRVVKELFGRLPAHEFGPKKLKAVQQAMTAKEWSRNYVNEQIGRVKRMFKWATQEELIPGDVWHSLQAVEGLRRGSPGVRETEPVKPVPESFVQVALPFLPAPIRDMIELQQLTGMRPGEVCIMRACDFDMTGTV